MPELPSSDDNHRRNDHGSHQAAAYHMIPGFLSSEGFYNRHFFTLTNEKVGRKLPHCMVASQSNYASCPAPLLNALPHHHKAAMASPTLTQSEGADHSDAVIGDDTHKEFHVAVALAPNGGRLGECSIPANRQVYGVLHDWALELSSRPAFAVEGTGSFGAGLCRELLAAGYSVVEINRPDRFTRRRLGKDDAIDAEAAARSFLTGTAKIASKGGTRLVEMIRLLKGIKTPPPIAGLEPSTKSRRS